MSLLSTNGKFYNIKTCILELIYVPFLARLSGALAHAALKAGLPTSSMETFAQAYASNPNSAVSISKVTTAVLDAAAQAEKSVVSYAFK